MEMELRCGSNGRVTLDATEFENYKSAALGSMIEADDGIFLPVAGFGKLGKLALSLL